MIMYENLNMIECGGVSCYIVKGKNGDVLIDTGREQYRDHIETWLMNYNVKLIILTHGHASQMQNAAYFSKLYNAPIMASPLDMSLVSDSSSRPYYITNPWGHILKKRKDMNMRMHMNSFEPDICVEEGTDLSPYGIDGVIVNLEGHTGGSIGVLCKSSVGYDLYAGDAVANLPFPMFPMTAESPLRAREAIERIIDLAPDRILVSHGKPICCGDRSYKLFIDRS